MARPRRPSSSGQPSEIQRLLVMVEPMQGDIRRIAEGHATLERMLAQTREELTSRIGDLENRMNLGFQKVWQELGEVRKELGQIKRELAQLRQAVSEIDRRLQTHENQAHAT